MSDMLQITTFPNVNIFNVKKRIALLDFLKFGILSKHYFQ